MTGSHDKFMMLADIQGHVQRTWKASHVHDLAISKDGRLLFCVTSEKKVLQSILHQLKQINLLDTCRSDYDFHLLVCECLAAAMQIHSLANVNDPSTDFASAE